MMYHHYDRSRQRSYRWIVKLTRSVFVGLSVLPNHHSIENFPISAEIVSTKSTLIIEKYYDLCLRQSRREFDNFSSIYCTRTCPTSCSRNHSDRAKIARKEWTYNSRQFYKACNQVRFRCLKIKIKILRTHAGVLNVEGAREVLTSLKRQGMYDRKRVNLLLPPNILVKKILDIRLNLCRSVIRCWGIFGLSSGQVRFHISQNTVLLEIFMRVQVRHELVTSISTVMCVAHGQEMNKIILLSLQQWANDFLQHSTVSWRLYTCISSVTVLMFDNLAPLTLSHVYNSVLRAFT
jgi:hypothetical protein